jgi:FkbM family methyltransferase
VNQIRTAEKLKEFARILWCARSRVPLLGFSIPCRLKDGSRFLVHADAIGWRIFAGTLPFRKRTYEAGEWKFVSRFLKPGMKVVDVGANQGYYTLLAAHRVSSEGRVYAFEPAGIEVQKLQTNLLLNGYSNVTIERCAVGECEGITDFYECLNGWGSFSSCKPPGEDLRRMTKQKMQVPMTSLDHYAEHRKIAYVDLLKIDAEGAELHVLRGASRLLSGSLAPVVLCELEDRRTIPWGYRVEEIVSLLHSSGFRWFQSTPSGELVAVGGQWPEQGGNFVAVPPGRLASILQAAEEPQC